MEVPVNCPERMFSLWGWVIQPWSPGPSWVGSCLVDICHTMADIQEARREHQPVINFAYLCIERCTWHLQHFFILRVEKSSLAWRRTGGRPGELSGASWIRISLVSQSYRLAPVTSGGRKACGPVERWTEGSSCFHTFPHIYHFIPFHLLIIRCSMVNSQTHPRRDRTSQSVRSSEVPKTRETDEEHQELHRHRPQSQVGADGEDWGLFFRRSVRQNLVCSFRCADLFDVCLRLATQIDMEEQRNSFNMTLEIVRSEVFVTQVARMKKVSTCPCELNRGARYFSISQPADCEGWKAVVFRWELVFRLDSSVLQHWCFKYTDLPALSWMFFSSQGLLFWKQVQGPRVDIICPLSKLDKIA